jgi:hypothetical protein
VDSVEWWKDRRVGACRRGCGEEEEVRGKIEGAFVLGDDSKTDGASVLLEP